LAGEAMNSAIDAPYQARENGVLLEILVSGDSITEDASRQTAREAAIFMILL
jgi:hypothetical protein